MSYDVGEKGYEEKARMEHRVYSVPYALREQFVLTDDFTACLKQRGWRLYEHRPIYTDPQVIRQRYLAFSVASMGGMGDVNNCCCEHKRTRHESRRSLIASSYQAPGYDVKKPADLLQSEMRL